MKCVTSSLVFLFLCLTVLCTAVMGEVVHRVHNILLFPQKHSWCEAKPIKMVVSHTGCEDQIVNNHICVGQCFSYNVPRAIPAEAGEEMLHYCGTCVATKFMWMKIYLHCHDSKNPIMEKNVQLVQSCGCKNCVLAPEEEKTETDGEEVTMDPTDEDSYIDDITYAPELDAAKPPSAREFFMQFLDSSGRKRKLSKNRRKKLGLDFSTTTTTEPNPVLPSEFR